MGSCGAGRLNQPYAWRVWPLNSPWLGDSGESGPTVCDLGVAGRQWREWAHCVWPGPWLGDSGESGPTACDLGADRHEARVAIVHEELDAEGGGGEVVDAAGAVGDVAHDHRLHPGEDLEDVGDGARVDQQPLGELQADLWEEGVDHC